MTPRALAKYGLVEVPGIGASYPELKKQVRNILLERVSKLAWVPEDFRATVIIANDETNGLIKPYPALGATGRPNSGVPEWLLPTDRAIAWNAIATDIDRAQVAYANAKQVEGAEALQQLRDNADYWNAVAVGTGKVADAVSGGLSKGLTILVVGLGIGLLGVWWWKDPQGFKSFFYRLVPGKR